jgi:hypothetical protein
MASIIAIILAIVVKAPLVAFPACRHAFTSFPGITDLALASALSLLGSTVALRYKSGLLQQPREAAEVSAIARIVFDTLKHQDCALAQADAKHQHETKQKSRTHICPPVKRKSRV